MNVPRPLSVCLYLSLLLTLSFRVCVSAYGCVRTCVNDFYFSECKGSGTYCTQRTAAACCCCYGCYRWGIRLGSEKKQTTASCATRRDALRRWWWQAKKKTWGGISDRDGTQRRMGSIPTTINRKLNLQTHTCIHTVVLMYACIYVCIHDVGKLLMNQQRTCCLIDKWAQERKRERDAARERARERFCLREKREIRQSWLKSIVTVQVFVCTWASLSICVCVCMCDSAWNVWKNAANDGNGNQTTLALPAVVYTMWNSGMSKYLLVAWRLLRCCRVVVVAFAPDTRRLRRHTLQLNTMTWYWLNCFRCRLTPH